MSKRIYESVGLLSFVYPSDMTCRFPRSLPFVILDTAERFYIGGFALLQLFVILFPIFAGDNSALEFLPLMATSVYCAAGLAWAFLRLSIIYLRDA